MHNRKFILDSQWRPRLESDLTKWAMWLETAERTVQLDVWNGPWGELRVSTVFLGLDYQFGEGPPVLWETMVFSSHPDLDGYQVRCAGTAEQAEAMHNEVLAHVKTQIQIDESTEATHRRRSGLHPELDKN